MSHVPEKCEICGEFHCLAGCVPVENCYSARDAKLARQYPGLDWKDIDAVIAEENERRTDGNSSQSIR